MSESTGLLARIDAEFSASDERRKQFQTEAVEAYEGRQARLKQFAAACEKLHDIWRPKLDMLAKKFGDKVTVTPEIKRELRQATFHFQSELARVELRFTASTDADARKLVLDYNLEILPILMKFEPHSQIDFPLEAVDAAAVGKWLDDRIVDFVRTYLAMYQNEFYLKDHMVVDPVSGVKFPKFAAAATLERGGKTLYFVGTQTRAEFEKKENAAASGGKGSS